MEITLGTITDQFLRGEISEDVAIELAIEVIKNDKDFIPEREMIDLPMFMRRYHEQLLEALAVKFRDGG